MITDKDSAITLLERQEKFGLQQVSINLRNDKAVVVAAVQRRGADLEFASDRLRNDKGVVLAALESSDRGKNDADGGNLLLGCVSATLRDDKEIALAAVQCNGGEHRYVSSRLRNDRDVVLAALKSSKRDQSQDASSAAMIEYPFLTAASETLRDDKEIVLAAVEYGGGEFAYASNRLKNDKDVVLAAIKSSARKKGSFSSWENMFRYVYDVLRHASEALRDDKEIVLAAVRNSGVALKHASSRLRDDEEVVMSAMSHSLAIDVIPHVSPVLLSNKEFLLKLVSAHGCPFLLKHVSEEMQDDDDVVLAAMKCGDDFSYASDRLRNDRNFVLKLAGVGWDVLKHALGALANDRDIVMAAVGRNGNQLRYASTNLRKDKEVVLAAVSNVPESLQFALAPLNQDRDCLIAAGLWDDDYVGIGSSSPHQSTRDAQCHRAKIVLSTRFALGEASTPTATQFTVLLKQHPYIQGRKRRRQQGPQNFVVYSPNAFNKDTCDPQWTRFDWPCRGTFETCEKEPCFKSGLPTNKSCWRYSMRYQLEEAKRTNGFMVQIVELREGFARYQNSLGDGQKLESEMAKQVGVKVFKVFQPRTMHGGFHNMTSTVSIGPTKFAMEDIENLVAGIQNWYDKGCKEMEETKIAIRRVGE